MKWGRMGLGEVVLDWIRLSQVGSRKVEWGGVGVGWGGLMVCLMGWGPQGWGGVGCCGVSWGVVLLGRMQCGWGGVGVGGGWVGG